MGSRLIPESNPAKVPMRAGDLGKEAPSLLMSIGCDIVR